MKYRLKEQYALRGYENGESPVILDLKTLRRHPMSVGMMTVLQMCDGETDFDGFKILPLLKQLADAAVRKGWVVTDDASGKKLLPEQRYRILPSPDIQGVQWSITGKCNARCRHCFVNASQVQHKDLTTDEMLGIIDKIGSYNVPTVSLTGGEPLCRADLPILLKAMHERDIRVTQVCTNGFLLTDEIMDMFEEYDRIPSFQISFDGVGCHDWMRGVRGAERKPCARWRCVGGAKRPWC